jgi:DNA ligase (NAD+)
LSCYAFDLDDTRPGRTVQFEAPKFERLQELGFSVIEHQCCTSADEVVQYFETVRDTRDTLPFWIDGIVVRVDDVQLQSRLGVTANRPKGQVAWKFDSKGAETTLLAYSISVGHTGALIPTAQLEPVEIGGTTVSNALLNNWDEIERLGVAVGDRVWLIKANDIIPKIISLVEAGPNRTPIALPTECPVCHAAVARRRNTGGGEGAIIECTNPECDAKSAGKIKRWVKALDLQGLGDSVREALVDQLGLEDAADLYRLKDNPEALANLIITPEKGLRLGKKRAAVILEAIEARRELSLVEFLGSLGIDRLGQRRVELMITQAGGELDRLEDWTSGKLRDSEFAAKVGVPGVGPALQETIDVFKPVIDKLTEAGVRIVRTGVTVGVSSNTSGKTLCISGKLPSGKKKQDYKAPLAAIGIDLVDAVSKELTYLVVASSDSESSKTTKARKLGVAVISEQDLADLLQANAV